LTAIVDAVEKVADMISQVDQAVATQTTGIEQINQAVRSMEGMTQQNAALVEQAAASSASMSEQTQDMAHLLGFFRTGTDHHVRTPSPIVSHSTTITSPSPVVKEEVKTPISQPAMAKKDTQPQPSAPVADVNSNVDDFDDSFDDTEWEAF